MQNETTFMKLRKVETFRLEIQKDFIGRTAEAFNEAF